MRAEMKRNEDVDHDPADCSTCGREACDGHRWPVIGRVHAKSVVRSTFGLVRATTQKPEPAIASSLSDSVSIDDFYAYLPMHKYIFIPSGELWPAASVNARIPSVVGSRTKTRPSDCLDYNRPVEQMTWAPGKPMLIEDALVSDGGWIYRKGCNTFNLYRPPAIILGDTPKARPWLEHLERVYPDDAEHLIRWLAHRVQFPQEKLNHALVLGGLQGIGKDTLLEPVKQAVGPWNFIEVSPSHLLGRFNGYVKSVILRVSEARDLGDVNRFAFYDHMKAYAAAPPDVLRCDEKNVREYSVFNVMGVVITTNHIDGIFLPEDDRRHYVAWSDLTKENFEPSYWKTLWGWYASGGYGHVAAYLLSVNLSKFDPKAPPPKTPAFWRVVDASRAPEDAEMADVLDALGNPDAVTLDEIAAKAPSDFAEWLGERRNRRQIPHRLEAAGYLPVRNAAAKDGLWKVSQKRSAIYARQALSVMDRHRAAQALVDDAR